MRVPPFDFWMADPSAGCFEGTEKRRPQLYHSRLDSILHNHGRERFLTFFCSHVAKRLLRHSVSSWGELRLISVAMEVCAMRHAVTGSQSWLYLPPRNLDKHQWPLRTSQNWRSISKIGFRNGTDLSPDKQNHEHLEAPTNIFVCKPYKHTTQSALRILNCKETDQFTSFLLSESSLLVSELHSDFLDRSSMIKALVIENQISTAFLTPYCLQVYSRKAARLHFVMCKWSLEILAKGRPIGLCVKAIIKTCGSTVPLKAVPKLLSIGKEQGKARFWSLHMSPGTIQTNRPRVRVDVLLTKELHCSRGLFSMAFSLFSCL